MTTSRKVTRRTVFVVDLMTNINSCKIEEKTFTFDTKDEAYRTMDDWMDNGPGRNRTAIVTQRDIFEEIIAYRG